MATLRTVIVYGGAGALGQTLASKFSSQQWSVISVDYVTSSAASKNIILPSNLTRLTEQASFVEEKLSEELQSGKVDVVLCVAGGWAGGDANSLESLENAEKMFQQSVFSSFVASFIASKFLKNHGLFLLTGAKAARSGTPGMIGYGAAKAAVHQLAQSLSQPKSGLPENTSVVCILPVTLDTPGNRTAMPNADHSAWTPTQVLAEKIFDWSSGKEMAPYGKLVNVVTTLGMTSFGVESM